jgi:hypothetical protein
MTKPNPFEAAAREEKAAKLAGKIVELASDGVTPLEVFGRLTPEQWIQVAVLIGQKRPTVPSPATQLMVLQRLRARARRVA